MNTTELYLGAMLIVFSAPYLLWRLARTEYWAPLVVVQVITGILLEPGVLGAAFPGYYGSVFTPAVIQSLNGVAWRAVTVCVFNAGIELDLRQTGSTGARAASPLAWRWGCRCCWAALRQPCC